MPIQYFISLYVSLIWVMSVYFQAFSKSKSLWIAEKWEFLKYVDYNGRIHGLGR